MRRRAFLAGIAVFVSAVPGALALEQGAEMSMVTLAIDGMT
jgi:hypothetical protein